ncbi:hypothetical protein GCM10023238_15540 [Streptomyces heliomycini]
MFGLFGAIVGLGARVGPLLGALLSRVEPLFGWNAADLLINLRSRRGLVLGSRFITEISRRAAP